MKLSHLPLLLCSSLLFSQVGCSTSDAELDSDSLSETSLSLTQAAAVDDAATLAGRAASAENTGARQKICCGDPAPSDGWNQYGANEFHTSCVESEHFKEPSPHHSLTVAWSAPAVGGATSTPVEHQSILYYGDWSGALRAVRQADGQLIWSTTALPGAPIRSTPLVTKNTVYAGVANYLVAYARETGKVRWIRSLDDHPTAYTESSPVIAGQNVVIGIASTELTETLSDYTFRGSVVAVNAETGALAWKFYTSDNSASSGAGVSVWSTPSFDKKRGLIYVGTGQSYEQPPSPFVDSVLAIDAKSGSLVWQNQFTKDDVFTLPMLGPGPDFDVGATPTLVRGGNRDLLVVGSKAGILKAIDRSSGATAWVIQLGTGSAIGGIMASAAATQGVVYVNSNDWVAYGFLSGTNSPLDTSTTYAVDVKTGHILWKTKLSAPMFGAVTVANAVVFQGLIDGSLVALDARDGSLRWRDTLPGAIGAGVSVTNNSLSASYGLSFFKIPPGGPQPAAGVVTYR